VKLAQLGDLPSSLLPTRKLNVPVPARDCAFAYDQRHVAWKSILDEIACRSIPKFAGVVMWPESKLAIMIFMSLSPTW
jgi:hypothetical protein